jgi:prepilin-type processing-associated H-X9-DG protein
LLELLVVVAITAVLISILLPSMGRARDQAKVIKCAGNLRQLNSAIFCYASENGDTMLPAVLQSGSYTDDLWCGDNQLGPIFGLRRMNSLASQAAVRRKLVQMLDCPSVEHPDDTVAKGNWEFDYSYNQAMGMNLSFAGQPPVFQNGWSFIKRSNLRRQTLIALDVRDATFQHDYMFSSIQGLVPANPVDFRGIAGTPHVAGTKGNMLFADGAVILDDPNKLDKSPSKKWIIDYRLDPSSPFPYQ